MNKITIFSTLIFISVSIFLYKGLHYDPKKIESPSKPPDKYTQAELLTLMDEAHWDDMFATVRCNRCG